MSDRDQALERAIKQETDAALAHLVFDERLKAAVRQKVAQLEVLPAGPVRPPVWKRWQPYAWSTLAAAAITGIVLMSTYRSAPGPQLSAAAPQAAPSQAGASGPKATAIAPVGPGPSTSELAQKPPAGGSEVVSGGGSPVQRPMGVMSAAPAGPVNVEIAPQGTSVTPGQPLTFTIKVTDTAGGAASLGSNPPRLVIKSIGTKTQLVARVPVPDLAGKQLAARDAQVSAQAVWGGSMTPGWYAVSLEGLTVASGKDSVTLSPGGGRVLVQYTGSDALVKTLTPNLVSTAQDITMTLQRIEFTAQGTRVALRFDGVPGTINNESITLQISGQDVLVPLSTNQTQDQGSVLLTAEFNPLPATTRNLTVAVGDLQMPGQNGVIATVAGPWQVTVNP